MQGRVQVKIESMAHKGYGVARVDHKVLFVPFSVTGDEAWAEIIEEKKDYGIAKIETLIKPSSWRTSPQCRYFCACGGCQWQHIDYSVHGELKKNILTDILQRMGGQKEIPPIIVIPSPKSYGYRIRVQLKMKGTAFGYYQERSHHIVDIEYCPIAHPLVNQLILLLRKRLPFPSQFEEVEMSVSPGEGKGVLLFRSLSFAKEMKDFAKELLQGHPILLKGIMISGKGRFTSIGNPFLTFPVSLDRAGEKKGWSLRASPESFFQVNVEQNQALLQTVLGFAEVNADESVLDLYAGLGNLTLPLALGAKNVLGIEENEKAVEDGRFNIERNEIKQCRMKRGRVEEVLKNWNGRRPDLVVLDPPRSGGKEVVNHIIALKPKRIVYVSCDPATLARDLRLLSETGYSLQEVSLIDMFPQTYHMEVIALLKSLY
jgi:23S rRNA (uracil1939-C5)-methyltransferase